MLGSSEAADNDNGVGERSFVHRIMYSFILMATRVSIQAIKLEGTYPKISCSVLQFSEDIQKLFGYISALFYVVSAIG